jgi:hypothetical protein
LFSWRGLFDRPEDTDIGVPDGGQAVVVAADHIASCKHGIPFLRVA